MTSSEFPPPADDAARFRDRLATPAEIIEDARNGRMFILVDDEDRENEGDLIIPAQFVTPDIVNFMAKHGRGLICLAMTRKRADFLRLRPMQEQNMSRHETAFTVSIEAREGISTGISAADRARTIQTAIDAGRGPDDLVSPGHVFPLVARDGGVLIRAGHTEAAVDIARLAGLTPAGVICEIMNEDGTMSRLEDLVGFAQLHGLRIGTIKDLISYRLKTDTIIEEIVDQPFTSTYGGDWRLRVFLNKTEGTEHLALVKGDISPDRPAMVRMHAIDLLEDLFGLASGRAHHLNAAMLAIAEYGAGAVVMPREADGSGVSHYLAAERGTEDKPGDGMMRAFGLGCLILNRIGARKLILLSNSGKHPVAGLEGFGLNVIEERRLPEMRFVVDRKPQPNVLV